MIFAAARRVFVARSFYNLQLSSEYNYKYIQIYFKLMLEVTLKETLSFYVNYIEN